MRATIRLAHWQKNSAYTPSKVPERLRIKAAEVAAKICLADSPMFASFVELREGIVIEP